jgi:hypothetical protein
MGHLKAAIQKKAAGRKELLADTLLDAAGAAGMSTLVPGAGGLISRWPHSLGMYSTGARGKLKKRGPSWLSIVPGVGSYRRGLMERAVADEAGDRGRQQQWHEVVGSLTGNIVGAGTGAAIGGLAGKHYGGNDDSMVIGAAAGGIAGMLAPNVASALLAMMKQRRTDAEQAAHERGNLAKNYIPGVGNYNRLKRLGYGYDKYFKR